MVLCFRRFVRCDDCRERVHPHPSPAAAAIATGKEEEETAALLGA